MTECVAILTYHLGGGSPIAACGPRDTEAPVRAISLSAGFQHRCIAFCRRVSGPSDFLEDIGAHPQSRPPPWRNIEKNFADIEKCSPARPSRWADNFTVVDPFIRFLVFYHRWAAASGIPMKERYPIWTKHAQRVAYCSPHGKAGV